jgi:hypothetical protein
MLARSLHITDYTAVWRGCQSNRDSGLEQPYVLFQQCCTILYPCGIILFAALGCRALRDQADLLWLSNERTVGDFGVSGVRVRSNSRLTSSEEFLTAIFREFGIR